MALAENLENLERQRPALTQNGELGKYAALSKLDFSSLSDCSLKRNVISVRSVFGSGVQERRHQKIAVLYVILLAIYPGAF